MAWVDIFSTGTKTSRQGVTQDFPLSRLASAVETYDPSKFRAPLIVRHDTKGVADAAVADQPFCFGYPKELQIVGDKLRARFDNVASDFKGWVKEGKLISISPSFYTEDDPRNPTPGKLHLRHIAALGADLPADKNLQGLESLLEYSAEDLAADDFDFSVDADWLHEFEEPTALDHIKNIVTEVIQPLGERLDALTQSAETASATTNPPQELEYMDWDDLVKWAIKLGVSQSGKSIVDIASAADITPERLEVILNSKEAEPTYDEMQKIVPALGIEIEFAEPSPRELAIRQREADLVAREAELLRQQVIEFTEPLVADGRVLPGDRSALESVLLHLEQSTPIEFAEGEETVSKAPAEVLRGWMSRLKPQIEFREVAPGEDEETPSADFTEPPGYHVEPSKQKQLAAAKAHQRKNGGSMDEALRAVGVK